MGIRERAEVLGRAVADVNATRLFVGDVAETIRAADAREMKRLYEAAVRIAETDSSLATRAEARALVGALSEAVGALRKAIEERQGADASRVARPPAGGFLKEQLAALATPDDQEAARRELARAAEDAVADALGGLGRFVETRGRELDEATARIRKTANEYAHLKGGQAGVAHYALRLSEMKDAVDDAELRAARIAAPVEAIVESATHVASAASASKPNNQPLMTQATGRAPASAGT